VVVSGKEDVTCLTCHNVHKPSGKKHHLVTKSDLCWNCHNPTGPMKVRKSYEVHSATCGY
jgi:predicted CXXCH cytochrome family protein